MASDYEERAELYRAMADLYDGIARKIATRRDDLKYNREQMSMFDDLEDQPQLADMIPEGIRDNLEPPLERARGERESYRRKARKAEKRAELADRVEEIERRLESIKRRDNRRRLDENGVEENGDRHLEGGRVL